MSRSGAAAGGPGVEERRDVDEHGIGGYLRAQRAVIDDALRRYLPAPPDCPPLIAEAMRHSLFAGGKRLRPILTLAAADAVGPAVGPAAAALATPAACAIEMIHTYSLVHDDLPAMDDDTLRRGRPTAHVAYGEGVAVLAGDALLTEAFRVLARWPETTDAAVAGRKLLAAARVAEAAGAAGMVGGQTLDLQAAGRAPGRENPAADVDGLRAMHERKTGALIRAAAAAGAIMAGAAEAERAAVDAYASRLGLGFQIVDDILDVEGAAAALGKTAGKDAAAGKPTYPSMLGLDRSRRLARRAVADAKDALRAAGLTGRLDAIADWVLARTH